MSVQPPSVDELAASDLEAVVLGDTDAYPLADAIEVPAALAELEQRAAVRDFASGDEDGPRRAEAASKALGRLEEHRRKVAGEAFGDQARQEALDELAAAADAARTDAIETAGRIADALTNPQRGLLEAQGYQALRAAALSAAQSAGTMPIEVIDTAIAYSEAAGRRLRLDARPGAAEAVRQNEYELAVMRLVRTFRRELGKLDKHQAARDSLRVL